MIVYSFEILRSIAYASNSTTELIRDKRDSCEQLHRHDYYEMIYIYEGECIHIINDISYRLTAGNLVLLTPGDSHSIISTSEVSAINVCFIERKELLNLPTHKLKTPIAELNLQSQLEIETLLYLAEQELNLNDSFSESIIDRCIDWLLLIFGRNTTTLYRFDPIWNKLLSEIAEHYNTITLEEAAKTVGVSVSHFCRIFKRDFSMTFHAYLNLIRMRQAKYLLLHTDDSVSAIAERTGYSNNPCRFYSNFKTTIGMTPNDFRKAFRKNSQTPDKMPRSFIPEPQTVYPDAFSPYNDEAK